MACRGLISLLLEAWLDCVCGEPAFCILVNAAALLPPQSIQAALTEQEQAVAQRDAEVASLQAHVARLLGVPEADVPALHAARFGPQAATQLADRAAAARIAALEVGGMVGRQACMTGRRVELEAFLCDMHGSQVTKLPNPGTPCRLPMSGWRWRWWRPPAVQRPEVPALLPSLQPQAARQTWWPSCRRSWLWLRGALRRLTSAWHSWRSCSR